MHGCTEANSFLRHYLMREQIGSEKSWEVIGRTIYDYFGFLEAQELAWNETDDNDGKNLIEAYRDYCLGTAKLKRNTVRLRLGYVCEFYKFAMAKGWIASLPFTYEIRHVTRQGGFLAHTDASGRNVSVRSVMPRKHKELIKFLTREEVKSFLGAVANNPHHQMIVRLALQTGLRREELASFPLAYVIDPHRKGIRERNIRVTLDPQDGTGMQTKGSRPRVIYVSTRLMCELHHYAVHCRGQRASLSERDHGNLFLTNWDRHGLQTERVLSAW